MPAPRKKDFAAKAVSESVHGKGPDEIISVANQNFPTVAKFVGFSGGFDSLVATHWAMNNVPGCQVFHANTGIGIERTREFVRETCAKNNWPLREIRAKEDCGKDYDAIVEKNGFPGPASHSKMFQALKERPVRKLLMSCKTKRSDQIMLITGIRMDESVRRSGYKYSVIDFVGNVLWVNPFYYKTREWFAEYIEKHNLQQNPVSKILGMSGECLCGAFAHAGEMQLIKLVCPETYARLKKLEETVKPKHGWGWEEGPPRGGKKKTESKMFMPFCVGCEK